MTAAYNSWQILMIACGFRSACHYAPIVYSFGWSWKDDGNKCSHCRMPV